MYTHIQVLDIGSTTVARRCFVATATSAAAERTNCFANANMKDLVEILNSYIYAYAYVENITSKPPNWAPTSPTDRPSVRPATFPPNSFLFLSIFDVHSWQTMNCNIYTENERERD